MRLKASGNKRLNLDAGVILQILFVVMAMIEGLLLVFLIPFGQTPDEMTHFQSIEEEFGTTGIVDQLISEVFIPGKYSQIPTHPEIKVDSEAAERVSGVHFSPDTQVQFHPKISIVKHLPAGIGFYVGVLLHAPMVTCAHMAEICSLIFYVLMGLLTIRTTPIKKELFAFCLLIPMSLQQAASVNYDAVLIPCAFLLFAYILKLYGTEMTIRWKQIGAVCILTLVLALIKPPYVLIAPAMFIIPASRYQLRIGNKLDLAKIVSEKRVLSVILGLGTAGLAIWIFRDQPVIKTAIADVLSFPEFLRLLFQTASTDGGNHLLQLAGVFGWLDSRMSNVFIVGFYLMIVFVVFRRMEHSEWTMSAGKRCLLAALFLMISIAIAIALQEYTYKSMQLDRTAEIGVFRQYIGMCDRIDGIQGRYWIPCLPVILTALSGEREWKHPRFAIGAMGICMVLFSVHVVNVLSVRYW